MKKVVSLFILTAILCTFIAGVALAQEPNNLVTGIATKGNKVVPAEDILSVVKTKVGEKIDNDKLRSDLEAVFALGYFFNVQVAFESHLGGVKLIFDVVENPKVTDVQISGTNLISVQSLKELMKTTPGQMLNTNTLNQDLRAIEEYYGKQGLILAYIEDVAVSPEGVLNVIINEGFIQEIKIKGNEKTKDYVIRRELHVKPGDVFDWNKLQGDLQDIGNLGYFNNVQPRIERAEEGTNKVNLVVEVEEKKTGDLQIGAGYSSKDGWLGYMEVKEQNLLGRGQMVGFKFEFGQSTNYELNFYDPWAFGEDFSFGVDLYNTTNRNIKDGNSTITKYSKGASVQVGKPLYEDIMGSLKFKYDNTRTPAKNEYGDTRSLTLGVVRNTTDNIFNPHTGGKESVSVEYAGQLLGGNYDFTKYNMELTRYIPGFKNDHTWAFRLKSGVGTGDLPSHEEFKLGGAETLRGFDTNAFSGNKFILMNAEYRFPIVKSIEGAVFADSGNAWNGDINLKQLRLTGGLGVRMNTPLGQIRLDYGITSEGSSPHFSIGQTF